MTKNDDEKCPPPLSLGHGPSAILRNVKTAPGRRLTPDETVALTKKQRDFMEEKDPPKGG